MLLLALEYNRINKVYLHLKRDDRYLILIETSREHFLILFCNYSLLYSYSILQRKNTPLGVNFAFDFEN